MQLLEPLNPSLAAVHRRVVIAEIEHGLVNATVSFGLMDNLKSSHRADATYIIFIRGLPQLDHKAKKARISP